MKKMILTGVALSLALPVLANALGTTTTTTVTPNSEVTTTTTTAPQNMEEAVQTEPTTAPAVDGHKNAPMDQQRMEDPAYEDESDEFKPQIYDTEDYE